MSRKTFLLAQKIGGQVIGAFDSGTERRTPSSDTWLVSPCLCRASRQTESGPQPYLHSHMLAVRESLPQPRAWARNSNGSNGVRRFPAESRHMEWTFDPLEIKNAFLNIHRLGAIARELSSGFLWCILFSTAGWAPN